MGWLLRRKQVDSVHRVNRDVGHRQLAKKLSVLDLVAIGMSSYYHLSFLFGFFKHNSFVYLGASLIFLFHVIYLFIYFSIRDKLWVFIGTC